MGIVDKVARLEKQLGRLAERQDVSRQPVEIRRAILEDIEEHVEPAGRSRRLLPYNRVSITVAAAAADRPALEALLEPPRLKEAIEEHLQQSRSEVERDFEVAVRFVKKPPAHSSPGQPFTIAYERKNPAAAPGPEPGGSAVQPGPGVAVSAQVVVLKGRAARRTFPVVGDRTNIGRLAEVTDQDHRVVRRNQVVFVDVADEANRTVSRAHAHIQLVAAGEFRLHDDRSAHGTRIFRDGRTIEIPSGSPRGTRLRAGDEIYFGQAAVRFELKTEDERR
jgi:hypothetical protein